MKTAEVKSFVISTAIVNGFISLIAFVLVLCSYHSDGNREAWRYFKRLEEPLREPWNLSPMQIQAMMNTWQGTFTELQVKDSQKEAYDHVARIKAEAQALQGRIESLSAPEYMKQLGTLRSSVTSIPRIGEAAYLENNPWFASLGAYVWECKYYIFIPVGVLMSVLTWICYTCCFGSGSSSTESGSGGSSSGGGGGGGSYYGGGGGSYIGGGDYYPGRYGYGSSYPMIYPMPFSGDGQQSGYPPFGSF